MEIGTCSFGHRARRPDGSLAPRSRHRCVLLPSGGKIPIGCPAGAVCGHDYPWPGSGPPWGPDAGEAGGGGGRILHRAASPWGRGGSGQGSGQRHGIWKTYPESDSRLSPWSSPEAGVIQVIRRVWAVPLWKHTHWASSTPSMRPSKRRLRSL
jgi:hypothetical protein